MLDLQNILQTLLASGTPVVIIAAGLPGTTGMVQVMTPRDTAQVKESAHASVPAATTAPGAPAATELSVASVVAPAAAAQHVGPDTAPAKAAVGRTPLDRLRHDEQRNGPRSRQPEEWAKILGLSGRELRRAVRANALTYEVEQFGRGHGARLITTSALRGYLETIDAVERNGQSAPAWFTKVRRQT